MLNLASRYLNSQLEAAITYRAYSCRAIYQLDSLLFTLIKYLSELFSFYCFIASLAAKILETDIKLVGNICG